MNQYSVFSTQHSARITQPLKAGEREKKELIDFIMRADIKEMDNVVI